MENEVKMILNLNLYEDILRIAQSDINFSKFRNKTVLISGAGELLGFYLVCSLLISNDINGTNAKIITLDKNDSIFKIYGKLTHRIDIDFIVSSDFSNLQNNKADFFIHTQKPESEAEICNIINYIKTNNCNSVICSFSDIYGDVFNGQDVISEEDIGYCDSYKPESSSIQLQRLFEAAAVSASKEFNLDIKLSRLCQIFGYREYGNKTDYIKIFKKVAEKENIEITQSDKTLSSYIYVTDAAEAIFTVLTKGKSSEIYNISSGFIASNHIIAKYCVKLFEHLGIKIIYKDKEKTLSPMAPTLDALDNSKLKALGFIARTDMQNGIVRAIKNLYEERE